MLLGAWYNGSIGVSKTLVVEIEYVYLTLIDIDKNKIFILACGQYWWQTFQSISIKNNLKQIETC